MVSVGRGRKFDQRDVSAAGSDQTTVPGCFCPHFLQQNYQSTFIRQNLSKTYPKLIIKPYCIISFCKLHLPLPQVVEGVVDPGENKLGSRVGRGTLARLNLPPSWSHCCRRQMVRRRSRRRLSSTLCPAQVLPLYPGLQR